MNAKQLYQELLFLDVLLEDPHISQCILDGVYDYRTDIVSSYKPDFDELSWQSDWDGAELGHDECDIVGLYSHKVYPLNIELDVFGQRVIDAWIDEDYSYEQFERDYLGVK
jgi:hypothetical protein